jgi:hypothetical protein
MIWRVVVVDFYIAHKEHFGVKVGVCITLMIHDSRIQGHEIRIVLYALVG